VAYPKALLNEYPALNDLSKTPRPYYLWDTTAGSTIETSTLSELPDYVCISHIWGRWCTGVDADIPNVSWKVPENSRFDIKDLPRHLTLLGYH